MLPTLLHPQHSPPLGRGLGWGLLPTVYCCSPSCLQLCPAVAHSGRKLKGESGEQNVAVHLQLQGSHCAYLSGTWPGASLQPSCKSLCHAV